MQRPSLATVQSGGTEEERDAHRTAPTYSRGHSYAGSAQSIPGSMHREPFEDIGDEYIEPDDVGEERARELFQ